jgi:hypothetical protein
MSVGFNALSRLVEHAKKTGKFGTYVVLDVHNLGGLTGYLESILGEKEGRKKADSYLGVIASILRKCVLSSAPELSSTDFFRYEDDELGIVSSETLDVVEEKVYQAVIAISKYEKDNNLEKIEHRRNSLLGGGFGLSYAAISVDGSYSAEDICEMLDINIGLVKNGIIVPYSGSSKLIPTIEQTSDLN